MDLRQLTRRYTERNAGVSWMDALVDSYNIVFGLMLVGAMLQPLLRRVGTHAGQSSLVDGLWLAYAGSLAVLVALAMVLDRIGPLHVNAPQAQWWLPTLASRSGILRPVLIGVVVSSALLGALSGTVIWLTTGDLVWVGSGSAGGALIGVALVLHQPRGRVGVAVDWGGLVLIGGVLLLALVGAPAPRVAPILVAGAGAGLLLPAVALAAFLHRVPARLHDVDLASGGRAGSSLMSAVLQLQPGELAVAFSRGGASSVRRSRPLLKPIGAKRALLGAHLLQLRRSPRRLIQLAAGPIALGLAVGVGAQPVVVALILLAGGLVSALSTVGALGAVRAVPALSQLLPVSALSERALQLVIPTTLMVPVASVMGISLAAAIGAPWAMGTALGACTAPVWVAAAARVVTRPRTQLSGAVVSTPMGAFPADAAQVFGHGLDLALVALTPVWWALATGMITSITLLAEAALAAAAVIWVILSARRR